MGATEKKGWVKDWSGGTKVGSLGAVRLPES